MTSPTKATSTAPDIPPAHVHNIGPVVACLPIAGTPSLSPGHGATYAVTCWRRNLPDSRAYSVHMAQRDTRPKSPTFGAWLSVSSGIYDLPLDRALARMVSRAGYEVTSA